MTKPAFSHLFTPVRLGPLALPHRAVMAPMTRNRAGPGNVPQDLNVTYYRQRAKGALILTEATQISPQGVGYPATPGIHSAEQVAGWQRVTDAVHEEGGWIFLQLWHVGRISHPSLQPDGALPVAPSAIRPAGEAMTYEGLQPFVTPRELVTEEIPGLLAQFETAARNAHRAGFDGVEIHAANGYLLDQFLRDGTNRRTDRYGGSLMNRARLLHDVVEAVAGVWGADRVGVRLSPLNAFNDMQDSAPETTFPAVASMLGRQKLAYLHVVEVSLVGDVPPFDWPAMREAFGGLYMANGGYDGPKAEAAIAEGRADLVSFARPFLANPDLVHRLETGAALNEPDPATFYGGDAKGYTDYPTLAAS
ncbi:MAG: alkene reductase [Alphaproteobacteria bacterium]|nr:alkene reductase [Alphaproteobacteria bacterium]